MPGWKFARTPEVNLLPANISTGQMRTQLPIHLGGLRTVRHPLDAVPPSNSSNPTRYRTVAHTLLVVLMEYDPFAALELDSRAKPWTSQANGAMDTPSSAVES